jgi:hypothetical protein
LVSVCLKLDSRFPIAHIADWRDGACLQLKDPALLMTLRDEDLFSSASTAVRWRITLAYSPARVSAIPA